MRASRVKEMGETWPDSRHPPPSSRHRLTAAAGPPHPVRPRPTMLRLLLLCGALGCGAGNDAPLTFTMLQWTQVSKGSSVFWGNATLGGRLSHILEDHNVTQVLPLEPPAAWARQQDMVANYLSYFSGIVQVFSKERPLNYTQILHCRLGCCLFPNGTAHSFYEVFLNGTAFLTFHVPTATWKLRWPRRDPVATFAQRELMKYSETTHNLQHFLNTTCVDILRAQSPQTGKQRGRSHAPLVLGLVLGVSAVVGMAVGIFLCTGGSC